MRPNIFLVNIIVSFIINQSEQIVHLQKWQKVLIEKEHLDPLRVNNFTAFNASKFECGGSCSELKWCTTWCFENGNTCYLSNIIVSPSYVSSGSDHMDCLTNHRVDIVVGSAISSTPPYSSENDVNSINDGIKFPSLYTE